MLWYDVHRTVLILQAVTRTAEEQLVSYEKLPKRIRCAALAAIAALLHKGRGRHE